MGNIRLLLLGAWFVLSHGLLWGQAGLASLRGQVTDPSGRGVPGASVTLSNAQAPPRTTQADVEGRYQFRSLAPGAYAVRAEAKGFTTYERGGYEVSPGRAQVLDIPLALGVQSDQVTVNDAHRLSMEPSSNAGTLVLRGKDLDALADDRDDLVADLQALAGPAAGPSGGQIYIDGFTGGRLPPKSSIREVRVNQNPFSAQFDQMGYGRIEIFTKPGTEDFHGELVFMYGDDLFNSRNPFATVKPPYQRKQWEGEAGGPLGKKTSYSADFEIRRITENAFINALTLDKNLQIAPVSQGIVTPLRGAEENVKIDRQVTPNHTFSASYMYARDTRNNQGVGGFSLPSRAYRSRDGEDEVRLVETGVFGTHLINESRARYQRLRSRQEGDGAEPTITVLDAFTAGGAPLSLSYSNQDRYEVNNLSSLQRGFHLFRWGARLRAVSLTDQDTQNYAGAFTFTSLESYRLTLLGSPGAGPSQFSRAGGNPLSALNQFDVGLFAQDDWRLRPNVTLSLGLRYEAQSHLDDHGGGAPRLGITWGLGPKSKAPKTIIRAGLGVFYSRVSESLTLDAVRRDGLHQQQFVVASPDFYPTVPSPAQLASNQVPQAIRKVDARMRAPQLAQTALGIERQLPRSITLAMNYLHTRGLHSLRSRNINAPVPGSGAYPYGRLTAIYLYEASGRFKQDQLITSVNARVSPKLTLTGSYALNKAMSDTDGAGTFPADPYNLSPEYGRAGFDIRHRVHLNGSLAGPWGLRLSPLLTATSGRPFNVTLGRDLNGDTLFTDRPALATDLGRPSVVRTVYGALDLAPQPGQAILPRNYGQGPAQVNVNLRLTKTITLGEDASTSKSGKQPSRDPYEITFSVSARNLLNHPNLALPVGNLSSGLFGRPVALAGGSAGVRRLDLQVRFSF